MTLPDRLRAAIAPAHVAVEQTAFARGMVAGTIDRPTYAAGLRQLAHLHAALETALASADSPHVKAVYDPARMARAAVAAADAVALGHPGDEPAADPVARVADQFAAWADAAPAALVGALYVMEGSKMGSMILVRSLAKAFGVGPTPGAGLDYHAAGMATRPADWQRFRAAVGALDLTAAEQDQAAAGAVAVMDALVDLYATAGVADAVPA